MLCANCKREPEEFKTPEGESAYWFIVDSKHQDASYLMSSMETMFKVCTEKEFELEPETLNFCINCIEHEEDGNGED